MAGRIAGRYYRCKGHFPTNGAMRRIRPADRFVPFPKGEIEQSIPARFRRQVLEFPDRVAVRTKTESLTYTRLDHVSDHIASAVLEAVGDEPVPIALLLGQGAGMVAAILGTLKAGKMYVPLDPSDPRARIAFMLGDSRAALILTDGANRGLATDLSPQCATLNTERLGSRYRKTEFAPVAPGDPAYLFYTSGSTGEPKGVFDDHRNVLHNIMRYTNTLQIGADDRLTLLQSATFSGTVSSLFGALLNGATILPIDVRRAGLAGTAQWLAREQVTMYHSVPTLFQQIFCTGQHFPSLRVIRLEGDECSVRHVQIFRERCDPGCTLVNGLGATETGITRQYFIQHDAPPLEDIVPVGYATEDMEVLVVDEFGVEVMPGVAGEIRIRSRYLARGYWGKPKLTRELFLPWPGHPEYRIYRTGDVGRLLPDGCLEYLGRSDSQVKIMGQLVAIPALESALSEIDGIEAAVVAARDGNHARRLTGYVVPSVPPGPTVSTIRETLGRQFPRSMIPNMYVVLDELPVDANGKIDRRALPVPEKVRPVLGISYRTPAGETEVRVAAIWSEVLEIAPVGRDDDFFHLGGDSLAGMEVLLLVQKRFSVVLPDAIWFTASTVAEMAKAIEADRPSGSLVSLKPNGSLPPLFCIHSHVGQVLNYGDLAIHMEPERPFFALQACGLDGRSDLLTTIEAMAAHYIISIRRVQPRGPYRLGGFCFGTIVALEMAHQLRDAGEPVGVLVLIDPDPIATPGGAAENPTERLQRHAERWAVLGFKARIGYFASRTWLVTRSMVRSLGSRVLFTVWRLGRYRRRFLPASLRHAAFELLHARAAARYRPRPYGGHAVLLSADPAGDGNRDIVAGWQELITALEHQVVRCQHDAILVEPHVAQLARHLNQVLSAVDRQSEAAKEVERN